MATNGLSQDETKYVEPLIDGGVFENAAEMMTAASQTMLSAATRMSTGLGQLDARDRELTAEAVETGLLRALRRDSLLGGMQMGGDVSSWLRLPSGSGSGYSQMGASLTGEGGNSRLYGTIGGALGYAVGGPVGAVLGGMLGGLFGGDDDDEEQQQEAERQWLNTPEGFEIEGYLYNLAQAYAVTWDPGPRRGGSLTSVLPWMSMGLGGGRAGQVVVNMSPGAVQVLGQGEEGGERAARAFAGALGRVLQLNSVVVPAAGMGGGF